MSIEQLLSTPGAGLERGKFNDGVVVKGKWVARSPAQYPCPAN
ncbi:hypothetical protein AB0M48_15515 [Lentzea sp. NPDC051208]